MKLPKNHPYANLPRNRKTDIMLHYFNKYFTLFMQSRRIEGLSYEQNFFLMSSLWERGSVLCFQVPVETLPSPDSIYSIQGTAIENAETLVFTPYSPQSWNIYYQVNRARAIKLRGAPFIDSTRVYNINEDAVIVWGTSAHVPVFEYVNYYIKEIVDTQIAIEMNLYVNSQPKLVGVAPEDERAVKDIEDKIREGQPVIFTGLNDSHSVVDLIDGGANYIVDKLFKHKQEVEGELMTILGIQNESFEKKERLTDEEANINDSVTQLMADAITDTIQEGIEKINTLFGTNLSVIDNVSPRVFKEENLEMEAEAEGGQDNVEEKE